MLLEILREEWGRALVEIGLLTFFTYYVLMLIRGTRAVHVLIGLIIVWVFSVVVEYAQLHVFTALLDKFWLTFFVAVIVLFQPEFRRALAQIGQRGLFRGLISEKQSYLDEVVKAACMLSQKRVGALIVIEREASLQRFIESGVQINGEVNSKLLQTIFSPYTPLHDGATILQGGKVAAAACLLPLTERTEVDPDLGTRHRAAMGLTEELDAIVVVVSEETGIISVAEAGRLTRGLDEETLTSMLRKLMGFAKQESGGNA